MMSEEEAHKEGEKKKGKEDGASSADKKHALLQKLDLIRGMKRLKEKSKAHQAPAQHHSGGAASAATIRGTRGLANSPTSSRPTELPRSTSLKGVSSRPELQRSQSLHVWRR